MSKQQGKLEVAGTAGSALPPKPGSVMWAAKEDDRLQMGWWAPGEYINQCRRCGMYYVGDKRSGICADCAYDESPNSTPSSMDAHP